MSRLSSKHDPNRPAPEAHIAPEALRFFGRAGLLPSVSATAVATPEYDRRLRFIQRTQELGLAVHEIRELLAIGDGVAAGMTHSCVSIESQIENIEDRIIALMRVRLALVQTQQRLERHGPLPSCPIVAALQDESRD
jgi:DNA-binding transcriptional MerR regulator